MDFSELKYGLFVHYVHGLSIFSDGRSCKDIDETLNSFDVEGFARDVADTGAQYLVFTAWHADMIPLYPSEVTAKWRGKKLPRRDLLGEIIDAVNAKGVKMILYTHPRDGHDFSTEDRLATGWGEGHEEGYSDHPDPEKFDREKWNAYVGELYTELADRYAKRLYGFYTDGVGPYDGRSAASEKNHQVVDYLMLRDRMKSRNPEIVMIQNYFGYLFSDDYAMPEGYFGYENGCLESHVEDLPAAQKALAMSPFTGAWMPDNKEPKGKNVCRVPLKNAAAFVLFNASCTAGGGTVYATGPYCEGNQWPEGAMEYLKELRGILSRYGESVFRAGVSKSFPTCSGDTLAYLGGRFFTTSRDGRYEYCHLTSLEGEILLGESEDGAELFAPVSLTEGLAVESFDGRRLVLSGEIDGVLGVIRFERRGGVSPKCVWINDTDKRIRYSEEWKYHHLTTDAERQRMTKGLWESDLHRSLAPGASAFFAFEGSFVEIYGRGSVTVFVDGVRLGKAECELKNPGCRHRLTTTPDLHGGWHTLYLVTESEFDLDALRVWE